MIEVWDNSPELRASIESELDNWGAWSRLGATINLLYPSQMAGCSPPNRGPSVSVDEDKAWRTEQVLSTWRRLSDISGEVGVFLLKLKYIECRPIEKIAYDYRRKFKCSRSDHQILEMIYEAEMMYWLFTSEKV